jgi:hypothetical protein
LVTNSTRLSCMDFTSLSSRPMAHDRWNCHGQAAQSEGGLWATVLASSARGRPSGRHVSIIKGIWGECHSQNYDSRSAHCAMRLPSQRPGMWRPSSRSRANRCFGPAIPSDSEASVVFGQQRLLLPTCSSRYRNRSGSQGPLRARLSVFE